jgi:hypothetical protein
MCGDGTKLLIVEAPSVFTRWIVTWTANTVSTRDGILVLAVMARSCQDLLNILKEGDVTPCLAL